ncbi:MAG: amidohydrolase [Acidobacteria bacterium]|nr:amidohydrolase [Acidobacteriota bacterium]
MKTRIIVASLLSWLVMPLLATAQTSKKDEAVAAIAKHNAELIKLSDQIWAYAETALREHKSAKALADYAEAQGFKVERGVDGMPTAFIASYGQGSPVIGILGEFDALPGISQKASPIKEPLEAGAPGHGCGHNLFGTASLGAATAIKELIAAGKLKGTIRFYGTPAEESIYAKTYLARDGFFKDLDVCLAWHPDSETKADVDSTQAIVDFIVEFKGRTAHAAADPWNGRSAVDGLEAFTHGVNLLREHVKPTVRMHYAIMKGGDVPNVVPEYAKVWCWARDSKREGVEPVMQRLREIAEGAGKIAGVETKFTVQTGCYEILVNLAGAKMLQKNLEWLGPLQYTAAEQDFARALQRAVGAKETGLDGTPHPLKAPLPNPPGGSTDVGDVSWVVPTLHLSVTTAPEAAWHAWPVVASGGMSIGHKGMTYAAKTLAATMVDLFEDAAARATIQAEFKEKTKGFVYKPYIADGPPPVPKP